jgi:hypothetical protein
VLEGNGKIILGSDLEVETTIIILMLMSEPGMDETFYYSGYLEYHLPPIDYQG